MLQADNRLMHNTMLLFNNLKFPIFFWREKPNGPARKGPFMREMAHADLLLSGVKIRNDKDWNV